jgi:diguanylate cyclase (GGDEF)-like protein
MEQQHSGVRQGTRKGTRRDGEGLWDWNLKSNRIHFSPGWMSLVGCLDHELGNTPEEWFQRVHPEDRDALLREIEAARAEGPCEFDLQYRLRHKDGTYRWMSSRGLVVRDDDGRAIRLTGSQTDVTVETVTDPVTGLPNLLLLVDRLTQSIGRAQRYEAFHFAILLIDLGRPAGFARKPGPNAADPLLNASARRLETCLRLPDLTPNVRHNDLVARVKEDRFAVLLDGLKDLGHAKVVADRLLVEMLSPFTVSGREVRLSASIGIAVSATGYAHADDALRDAETALYRAQVLGGSHCELFDTAILQSEQADLQLEGDFEAALQRQEFELLYQPIVSIEANQIVGFEALVRWQHPVLGGIGPADFIPIAERTGFIVPLGIWILREACRRLGEWQATLDSKDLFVSVNLSGVQLRQREIVEEIDAALRDSSLQARSLALELTETVAMENPTGITTLLMRLRAMGVRISIDDFGTGYSSLAYLRQFPVDTLKIDRSFVQGIELDTDAAEIVASLIAMAQRLGLQVVAEGVENEEQLAVLRSLRCESAQGYLFAKPLDAHTAADLVTTGLPPRPEHAPPVAGASTRREPHSHSRNTMTMVLPGRAALVALAAAGVLASAGVIALFDGWRPGTHASAAADMRALPPGGRLVIDNLVNVPWEPHGAPVVSSLHGAAASLATEAGPPPRQAPAPGRRTSQPATQTTRTAVRPPDPELPVNERSPQPPGPEVPAPASLEVVHLHRFGDCRGQLRVSAEGVAFVRDAEAGNDTFEMKYTQFLQSFEGDTLTIKSASRTYRFKAADQESTRELDELAARMARFRSM